MYTEENEFDYNDYLEEENNYNSNKPFIDFRFIIKIAIIILLIVLIIFLVFKIKNKNIDKTKEKVDNKNNNVVLVDDNINLIRDASHAYFFQNEHLPINLLESKNVKVKELIEAKLLNSIRDKEGNVCGYNTSSSTITKNKNNYELTVRLTCIKETDEKKFYYDLNGICLNCNGENYNPEDSQIEENNNDSKANDTQTEAQTTTSDNNSQNENKENGVVSYSKDSNTNTKVCSEYSDWTTELKNDNNLERESRTLVKAYKNEVVYGPWSNATTDEIKANDNLEVKSYVTVETETKKTCSKESTTKPESRNNREITSRVESKKTTTKVCTGGKTYTKTLTKWDNSAYSCKSSGIGKVVCTYKTKKTCTNKTTTKNVTYYTYCDTKNVNVSKTYYTSRTISYNPIYTDYILESEIPDGYQRVVGSEIVQYRYREKCGK